MEEKQKNKIKKTSPFKVKKFDSKGEIDREVPEGEKCMNKLNELIRMFDLKIIGSLETSIFTPGLGKLEGITFSDPCADLRKLKSWIRTKVNNI